MERPDGKPPRCPECERTVYVDQSELGIACSHVVSHLYHFVSLARLSIEYGKDTTARRLLSRFWASRARRYVVAALAALPFANRCLDPMKQEEVRYGLIRARDAFDKAHGDLEKALPNAGAYLDALMINLR
jgi:muramidase (phage lysozyme)